MTGPGLSRRRALGTVAGVGAGLPVLAACGSDDSGEIAADPGAPVDRSPTSPAGSESPSGPGDEAAGALVPVDEVPVGGGVVLSEQRLVVTQPEPGRFEGFSAVCTHQGCTVAAVSETIDCPCHGSSFSITDGSPVQGPAPSPLERVEVVAEAGSVRLA